VSIAVFQKSISAPWFGSAGREIREARNFADDILIQRLHAHFQPGRQDEFARQTDSGMGRTRRKLLKLCQPDDRHGIGALPEVPAAMRLRYRRSAT